MEINEIQQLALSFFNMQGIKCKETENKVWEAEIPEKEQNYFNCGNTLRFTFDREKAELHRDVEMICDGSFLFRRAQQEHLHVFHRGCEPLAYNHTKCLLKTSLGCNRLLFLDCSYQDTG